MIKDFLDLDIPARIRCRTRRVAVVATLVVILSLVVFSWVNLLKAWPTAHRPYPARTEGPHHD